MAESAASANNIMRKRLKWTDGFALTIGVMTTGIFTSVGYTMGTVGLWGMIAVWVSAALIGLLQVMLFTEMALMFPNKTGGIGVFAHEAWRKYFAPIGPFCVYGYWMAWSLALSAVGLTFGNLVKAQWFPDTGIFFTIFGVDIGTQHFIAAGAIILVWMLNVLGVKPTVRVLWILNIGVVFVLLVFVVMPFITGQWSAESFTFHFSGAWGGWKLAIALMYLAAWSVYGTEIIATFAPEFGDTKRDVPKATSFNGFTMVAIYILVPIGAAGTLGENAIANDPIGYAVLAFQHLVGPASGFVTLVVCASMFASMTASSGGAGRALFGLAREGMTLKQLDHLGKRSGMPVRQMTLDMVVNVAMVFFLGSTLAVLFASNFGYLVCTTFAVAGFVLLRKDRPDWPRPFKLRSYWVGIAAVLAIVDAVIALVGFLNPDLGGYGDASSIFIALILLSFGPITYVIRKKFQDGVKLVLREWVPTHPDEEDPSFEGKAKGETATRPAAAESS
ncbi:APC family permease [Arthrobacter sp. NicSoilC5]|uniref:APC family permease n=1 Tax=Arthrobacter sp. NicSoilC5 TaxID=2831000 RepID=UPI001CC81BA6|nr:APC family permease [Arthrobacter sp. NicSoilC5]BCW78260.1 hypothetical protein NicSoilC5_02790 [Arthrobacter sp. NicSoilC5]